MHTHHIVIHYKEQGIQVSKSCQYTSRQVIAETVHSILRNPKTPEHIRAIPAIELIREWEGHNLLYDLHFMRSHTADVDFVGRDIAPIRLAYHILSIIYRHIHK